MKHLIDEVYQNIQKLDIQPTEMNVALLYECFVKLRAVYKQLPDEQEKTEENNE